MSNKLYKLLILGGDYRWFESDIEIIIKKSFSELIVSLKCGELNPSEVLLAYQHKAFQVNARCNCVIEFLYPNLNEVNFNGPFAGVPISVKENFTMKRCESYAGMSYYLCGPSDVDAAIIQVIKSLGGIPFVRTNVPQSMLSVLSSNPIDGTTYNPLALDSSPGGSSSGEAALIGAGASVLGFGTDIGGSIRLPAAMCGIIGFKPTSNRLSHYQMFEKGSYKTVPYSIGFLSRDVQTCIATAQAIWNSPLQFNLDFTCPPLKFSLELPESRPLRIGYYTYDGSYLPVPAAQRAVIHVKEKLEARGYELVPWKLPCTGEQWLTIFITSLYVDGGKSLVQSLEYDKIELGLVKIVQLVRLSRFRKIILKLYNKMIGNSEAVVGLTACTAIHNLPSFMTHLKNLERIRQTIYASWKQANLDAVISPAFGMASPYPINTTRKFTGMLTYLNIYNLANMPSGCLPSGIRVTENDLASLKASKCENKFVSNSYPTHSDWHRTARDLQLDKLDHPISVQVAAAPWRDELCLHVMQEIENAVKY